MTVLRFIVALCIVAVVTLPAQVPIDLSQAREFALVWKHYIGGSVGPPEYTPSPCGVAGMGVLSVGSSALGFACFTYPRIDTTKPVEGWGWSYLPFDYDGIPPLEYINTNGRIDKCLSSTYPFEVEPSIDRILTDCWGGAAVILDPSFSSDIDGDGYQDLVCDIGGGGFTARVIRGGPNAGRGCERIMEIPKVRKRNYGTMGFWKSTPGVLRILQLEQDSGYSFCWVRLYELEITQQQGKPFFRYRTTDSMRIGVSLNGDPEIGDNATITDTVLKKDWLLMGHHLKDGDGQNVLERFDVTEGHFTPTGERVTGVVFYYPWVAGYTLGTDRPVVAFHVPSIGRFFSYADDLGHPFAQWLPQGAVSAPVSGMVMINDQTGDGKPDLIVAGGTQDGMVALYTLDTSYTAVSVSSAEVTTDHDIRLVGTDLEVTLSSAVVVSAALVSTDGRSTVVLPPVLTPEGVHRYNLSSVLSAQAAGAYFLRVQADGQVVTIPIVH